VEGSGITNTLSGVISGTGAVTQTGAGTTILTGANTYSNGTTVTNGTVYVNNATGSGTGTGSVNVTGGTLSGSGVIMPSGTHVLFVNSGGVVAPGGVQPTVPYGGTAGASANSDLTVSTINFTGGGPGTPSGAGGSGGAASTTPLISLNSANLTFALGAGGPSTGQNYSGSNIIISGSADNVVTFTGTSVVTINQLSTTLNPYQEYVLIEGNGDTTYDTGTGSSLVLGATNALGTEIIGGLSLFPTDSPGNTFANDYTGQLYLVGDNIDLEVVPEPSTWALMLGCVVFMMVLVRHHRRKSQAEGGPAFAELPGDALP
jgi:autotransporter-associated beta strand protein